MSNAFLADTVDTISQ